MLNPDLQSPSNKPRIMNLEYNGVSLDYCGQNDAIMIKTNKVINPPINKR